MNRNKKENSSNRKRMLPGIILVSLAASVATFILLLNIEIKVLSDYEKTTVWVAAADLQPNLEIESNNMSQYFRRAEITKDMVPANAVEDIEMLAGSRTSILIAEDTLITQEMFDNEADYISGMMRPIIAGCKSEDLYQVVSGILRKGDKVNIYTVDDELGETFLMWQDVLVYQVFDSAGNIITSDDDATAAARINLLIEEGNAEQFYSELYQGSLRMVKIWDS